MRGAFKLERIMGPKRNLNYVASFVGGLAVGVVLASHFMPQPEPFGGAPDRFAAVLFLITASLFTFARFKTGPAGLNSQ